MHTVRLFASSPGDVEFERQRIEWVAERLNGKFAQFVRFETVRWENKFYSAHKGFQEEIPEAKDCHIVVAVFWSRLGTELPDTFKHRLNGKPYPSGSAYEVLSAIEARKTADHPDVYVFRKTERPTSPIDSDEELAEAKGQFTRLEDFFASYFHTPDGSFAAAYHTFRTTDEFEAKVEKLLESWVEQHYLKDKTIIWPIETKGSPFRGLAPFDAKHATVFFGRSRKVMRAVEHLKDAARRSFEAPEPTGSIANERQPKPFLLIVGPSGSGKSSLMRAGLAPRLTTPGVVPEVDTWRIALMRPGAAPFDNLVRALLVTGQGDDPGGFGRALPELRAGSEWMSDSLLAEFKAATPSATAPVVGALDRVGEAERTTGGFDRPLRADLLLLVDQLEDIFASGIPEAQRSNFAKLLAALTATKRVWVVATLRADLYNRLIKNRAFIALKDAGYTYDLAPPGPDEIAEIIEKSADAAGLVYETDPASGKKLDERLLEDTEGKDILPLLEFTLDRLFDERKVVGGETRLTVAAYRAMGGIDGAINQSAERALANLGEVEVAALPRLLRALCVPVRDDGLGAGAALTVHAAPIDEIVTDESMQRLVDALLEARIALTSKSGLEAAAAPSSETGPSAAEALAAEPSEVASAGLLRIAHQRVLECWDRARKSIQSDRDFFRIRDVVENQRRRWQAERERSDRLIPDGQPLAEAQSLLTRYGDELPPATRNFITQSARRATRNRMIKRVMQVSLVVIALLATGAAMVAVYFGNSAVKSEKRAVANFTAARETVDDLVTGIAEKLRDLDRISVRTVDEALTTVRKLVDKLEAESGGDPLLERTRGTMQYEFAKTFQSADDNQRALTEANIGLTLRDALARLPSAHADWHWDLALSLDQVGDIYRTFNNFTEAGTRYDQAFVIRQRLRREYPDTVKFQHALSLSLVRIGDLRLQSYKEANIPEKDAVEAARISYEEALNISLDVIRREPDEVRWQRELSWTFNKVGNIRTRLKQFSDALVVYEKGLCIRRYMSSRDDKNTLWKRDIAFSLEKVGEARQRENDAPDAEEAVFEALTIRRALADSDPSHTLWARELAGTLQRIGSLKRDLKDAPLAAGFYLAAIDVATRTLQRAPDNRFIRRQLDDSSKELAKVMGQIRTTANPIPSDAVLQERARTEESAYSRRILARQDNPLTCWGELLDSLGVPRPAKTAKAP
jgi:tetratricopeptide (TPR) repeat protein